MTSKIFFGFIQHIHVVILGEFSKSWIFSQKKSMAHFERTLKMGWGQYIPFFSFKYFRDLKLALYRPKTVKIKGGNFRFWLFLAKNSNKFK